MTESRVINCNSLPFEQQQAGERYEARIASVSGLIGAKQLGYRIVELPPGKSAWPYHAHYANEEMFFVLAGEGELRIGEERTPIVQGDFVSCPSGPEYAHQITNTGTESLQYLCVSTMNDPDFIVYPDSGKYAVLASAARSDGTMDHVATVNHLESQVDYWEGELDAKAAPTGADKVVTNPAQEALNAAMEP